LGRIEKVPLGSIQFSVGYFSLEEVLLLVNKGLSDIGGIWWHHDLCYASLQGPEHFWAFYQGYLPSYAPSTAAALLDHIPPARRFRSQVNRRQWQASARW
jgi:hypothetical protein